MPTILTLPIHGASQKSFSFGFHIFKSYFSKAHQSFIFSQNGLKCAINIHKTLNDSLQLNCLNIEWKEFSCKQLTLPEWKILDTKRDHTFTNFLIILRPHMNHWDKFNEEDLLSFFCFSSTMNYGYFCRSNFFITSTFAILTKMVLGWISTWLLSSKNMFTSLISLSHSALVL